MSKNSIGVWLLAARPKTLPVAIAPILVGSAMAWANDGFSLSAMLVAMACALLITIGTNFCNDYADFARGADTANRKGPTRVTQAGLISPEQIRMATFVVFTLATILGMYLVYRAGWIILLIGLVSIAAGILYTAGPWPFGYKGLGDLFVLVFFGPVAVGGTYYVQALEIAPHVIIVGAAPGLLATAVLLVNNIRDIEEDRRAGKMTTVVRFGRKFGIGMWVACVVIAALLPLEFVRFTGEHIWSGLTALILIPAIGILHGLVTIKDAARLNPLLGQTALLLLAHSVIFALTWVV